MVEPSVVEERIRAGIPGVQVVEIEDLTGTRDHYQAVIVSPFFEGKSRVEQHQAVYRALGELMAGPVHALALSTYTPEAWAARSSGP
ncbi:MAG: BolA family protein [Sandaracinaceae bacterium]